MRAEISGKLDDAIPARWGFDDAPERKHVSSFQKFSHFHVCRDHKIFDDVAGGVRRLELQIGDPAVFKDRFRFDSFKLQSPVFSSELTQTLSGFLLEPETREMTDGYAEVRQIFKLPNRIQAAGLYVIDGRALRNDRVRVLRSGVVVHDGTVASLKRFKDDTREVAAGYECGLSLDSFNDFKEGDQLEFYHIEKVAVS